MFAVIRNMVFIISVAGAGPAWAKNSIYTVRVGPSQGSQGHTSAQGKGLATEISYANFSDSDKKAFFSLGFGASYGRQSIEKEKVTDGWSDNDQSRVPNYKISTSYLGTNVNYLFQGEHFFALGVLGLSGIYGETEYEDYEEFEDFPYKQGFLGWDYQAGISFGYRASFLGVDIGYRRSNAKINHDVMAAKRKVSDLFSDQLLLGLSLFISR